MNQLINKSADRLYRLSNHLVNFDIAAIYLLEFAEIVASQTDPHNPTVAIRPLTEADVHLLKDAAMDFSAGEAQNLWDSCDCTGAFDGDSLIGYAWHTSGDVAAELNTAGNPFNGCAIELAADASYLFKVFVHPAHRGKGINAQMCRTLSEDLHSSGGRFLITLTEWNNRAFRQSVERMGFRQVGHCGEWVFGKRSHYRLPNHLAPIARFYPAGD